MEIRLDCMHYIGEKPCKFKNLCHECSSYSRMGIRILILKLGAMGDALRTTPILTAYKRKFPMSHITWVTDRESYSILNNNPLIDRLLVNSSDSTFPLLAQSFDVVICLDKDPSVTALAMKVDAVQRLGFAMSPYGTLDIFNDASAYALQLGLDDDLKFFRNKKTYQKIIYEMAELPYHRDPYIFSLTDSDESLANSIIAAMNNPGKGPLIGLNTGCGTVFPTKKWPDHRFEHLVAVLRERLDARVFLLGGKSESEMNHKIESETHGEAISTGHHSLGVFAGILKRMDAIVAGDTMALHLALALGTPVIGLFGPTCAQEIDFYDRGKPLIASSDCSPCYGKICRQESSCMNDILPESVFNALTEFVNYRET